MKEIFVIYNKTTGFIDGGVGRVDQDWDRDNADGSTTSESIVQILAENPDLEVVYLPNQSLPDSKQHKIVDEQIVDLDESELVLVEEPESNEELIHNKIREMAVSELKKEGKLSAKFK